MQVSMFHEFAEASNVENKPMWFNPSQECLHKGEVEANCIRYEPRGNFTTSGEIFLSFLLLVCRDLAS